MNPNEDFRSPESDSPIYSINCGDPDAVLQICPERPHCSSQAAGWDGLILKEHHQPAHTTPVHKFTHHVLILSPLDNVFEVEYQLGELSFQGPYGHGELMIIPAHTPSSVSGIRQYPFSVSASNLNFSRRQPTI